MSADNKYPQELRAGTSERSAVYRRIEDEPAERAASGAAEPAPLYSLGPGASPATPSGDVMIRFKDGVDIRAQQPEIEAAGYSIVRVLPYAPQAAIVRAGSGLLADTLNAIGRLERIPGVENVEPQMISERSFR
jgi:hypothetical protein